MARTFQDRDGDLRAVMETMLTAPEFWSPSAYRGKLKSPLEMVASAVRAVDADVDFSFALNQQLAQLGQPLYRKQEPTGYSSAGQDWVNSAALLARMNFANALAANRIPGVKVDAARFGEAADTARVARVLMLDLSDQARAAIDAGLKEHAVTMPENNTEPDNAGPRGRRLPLMTLLPPRPVPQTLIIAGLVLGSPDFQRR